MFHLVTVSQRTPNKQDTTYVLGLDQIQIRKQQIFVEQGTNWIGDNF